MFNLNYLFILILLFWISTFFIRICVKLFLPRLKSTNSFDDQITIIIPTRNEEQNIIHTLEDLKNQTHTCLEVIIVDDSSTDDTVLLISEYIKNDNRFKLIQLNDLPSNWTGKNWACYNGFLQSTSDYILFTDADVNFRNDCLSKSLSEMKCHNLDVLTTIPMFVCVDFWSRLIVPHVLLMINTLYSPLRLNVKRDPIGYLIGSFIFIRKSKYVEIGTHKKVYESIVEDKSLGELAKKSKLSMKIFHSSDLVSTKANKGFIDNFSALQRAIMGAGTSAGVLINYSLLLGILGLFLSIILLLLPHFIFLNVLYDFVFNTSSFDVLLLPLFLEFIIIISYLIEISENRDNNYIFALFSIISSIVFIAALFISIIKSQSNYKIVWRKRSY